MVSLEATSKCLQVEANSSPRISFSAEFLDENNFISICPKEREREREREGEREKGALRNVADFEFLSGDKTKMITADELFSEGKLLPFWQVQPLDKLNKIALKSEDADNGPIETDQTNNDERRISWFLDDDPSPRPPKCTVLWKELLRLKKQRRPSTLSPSSSSSSSSSNSDQTTSSSSSQERKKGGGTRDKVVNKPKKGLERTRSANIRIRPMINVPICTAALPPLFPTRRGRLES
ncbi:hypothetical protein C2S51_008242 [Perilla frutescens var. frutescens]|nr:hypothetical protein C2S51_008242 [Perilla frutescens var. frutescens]